MAVQFVDTPAHLNRPAPTLGQDNAAIYGAELGLDGATLDILTSIGVI